MSLPGARKHLPDDPHGQEQGIPQEAAGRDRDDISRDGHGAGLPQFPPRTTAGLRLCGSTCLGRGRVSTGSRSEGSLALAPRAWNKPEEARLRDTLSHWEVGI